MASHDLSRFLALLLLVVGLLALAPVGTAAPKHELLREDVGYVNAMTYGSTHTSGTVSAAVAAMAGAKRAIYLETGTWTIDALTIPSTATLWIPAETIVNVTGTMTVTGGLRIDPGGALCAGVGATITINGPMDLPIATVFCTTGTTTFQDNKHVPTVYPQWFGAAGDNTTDDTAAIQYAILSQTDKRIVFPPGYYRITSQLLMDNPHCAHLDGSGGQGGQAVLRRDDAMNDDLFLIRCAGGAFENLFILDTGTDTTRQGAAFYLTTIDVNNRAGFLLFNNIRITSTAPGGAWNYGLYINGSGTRVAGTAGIRDIFVTNSIFFGTREPGRTIFMDTCVHCFFSNVLVTSAPTSISQGVYIQGWDGSINWTEGVYFSNVEILGDMYIEARNVAFIGGILGTLASTPSLTIPVTSENIQIFSALAVGQDKIANASRTTSIVTAGLQQVAADTNNLSALPGTTLYKGFQAVVSGTNNFPDYQGLSILQTPNGPTIASLLAGYTGGGSNWNFGVSDSYPAGVNRLPLTVDEFGVLINTTHSLRFTGSLRADLSALAINGSIVYCTDCTEADPCGASGTGAFALRLNGRWKCN